MRDPAHRPGDREHDREHRARNADRAVDDARIEVNIRIELAGDEVLVLERNLLETQRKLEERVVRAPQLREDLVAHLTDDLGAGIEVLVHTVTEAHEPEVAGLVLREVQIFGDVLNRPDLLEHREHGLVGAAVCRPPKS